MKSKKVPKDSEKTVLPVSGMFSDVAFSPDLTAEVIAKELMSPENIALKSQHNLPVVLTQYMVLADSARAHGDTVLADFYEKIIVQKYLEFMCSKGGWRANQITEYLIADAEKSRRGAESTKERMVGALGKR